jgi:hypothetical protein
MRHVLLRRVAAATAAAAAVTAAAATVAVPAMAGIPPNPAWKSSAPFGAWNNGGFILYNNEWNSSHGPQTIWADSYRHWGAESTQAAGNTAIETYPCVQKNFNNVPVSRFKLIRNGFTESMPARTTGLDAEAADDIWLNNYKIEVMIWVDNHGQRPAGQIVGHATFFGQHYAVWHTGTYYAFVLDHNAKTGMTYMLASIRWLIHHHYLKANVTLAQVNFGWEIASTNGKPKDFTVTNYWLHAR